MSFIRVNNIELYYELGGDRGEPVVLVHGSWGDSGGWDHIFPLLSDKYRVLKYDRRGHSRSERPEVQSSTSEDVDDLAAIMQNLGMSPAHIIGNSFGGNIALKLAARNPELVRSLTVHDPPVVSLIMEDRYGHILESLRQKITVVTDLIENGEHEEAAELFIENIVFGPGTWEELPEESRKKFIYNAPTFLDEQRDPEWMKIDKEALSGIRIPVFLTHGQRSEEFFRLIVERLHETIPGSEKQQLEGMGHVPQLTHAEQYSELIKSFLQ